MGDKGGRDKRGGDKGGGDKDGVFRSDYRKNAGMYMYVYIYLIYFFSYGIYVRITLKRPYEKNIYIYKIFFSYGIYVRITKKNCSKNPSTEP